MLLADESCRKDGYSVYGREINQTYHSRILAAAPTGVLANNSL
jgi:hypothetical protein